MLVLEIEKDGGRGRGNDQREGRERLVVKSIYMRKGGVDGSTLGLL
jgi:hypothetical protein